jgi:exodeoxyribonuclease V alpha subunit
MAERMVSHFGTDIMHIIDDEPGRLIEVPGLGPKRSTRIKDAWAEQKAIKQVMIFLQGVGVSTSLAVKIYKKYGDESEQTVRQQPYRLASDVWGIGFKTADTIAASVGIAKDSPSASRLLLRLHASEAADDGHCYSLSPSWSLTPQDPRGPRDLIAPGSPTWRPKRARSSKPCRSCAAAPSRCGPSTSRPFPR